jgi:hypothetical protein
MKGVKIYLILLTTFFLFVGCGRINYYQFSSPNKNITGCKFLCSKTLYNYEKPKYPNLKFRFNNDTGEYCISKDDYVKFKIFNIKEKYYIEKLETVIKTCVCDNKVGK